MQSVNGFFTVECLLVPLLVFIDFRLGVLVVLRDVDRAFSDEFGNVLSEPYGICFLDVAVITFLVGVKSLTDLRHLLRRRLHSCAKCLERAFEDVVKRIDCAV